MFPAGCVQRDGERLVVSPANAIDCKATDVIVAQVDGTRGRERAEVSTDVESVGICAVHGNRKRNTKSAGRYSPIAVCSYG